MPLPLVLFACTTPQAPPPPAQPVPEPTEQPAPTPADPGLVSVESPHDVPTTVERLVRRAEEMGLTVFDVLDHADNAAGADLELEATRVVRVGNPAIGTPLMKCSPTVAIDLPQRLLVHAGEDGTAVVYNDPSWLAERHGLSPCGDAQLDKVSGALQKLVQGAVAPAE